MKLAQDKFTFPDPDLMQLGHVVSEKGVVLCAGTITTWPKVWKDNLHFSIASFNPSCLNRSNSLKSLKHPLRAFCQITKILVDRQTLSSAYQTPAFESDNNFDSVGAEHLEIWGGGIGIFDRLKIQHRVH